MKKEALKKIMTMYGFYSLNKEPFLYEKETELGIAYTFKDAFFGELTRIYVPKNEEEATDFLAKYSWYKKYGQKYQIKIVLSDYKLYNPEISFIKDEKKLSLEGMKQLIEDQDGKKETTKKDEAYIEKLQRTLLLLVEIIKEKIKIQEDTYKNLFELTKEFRAKHNQLEKLKKEYDKKNKVTLLPEEEFTPLPDLTKELKTLSQDIEKITEKEVLEQQIDAFIEYLKSLEKSESLIKNKYELLKIPLEVENMNKEIQVYESYANKKKGLFTKKTSISQELAKIEKQSVVLHIVSFEQFKENEIKRIEEKYAMIPDLDKRTISDFLIEFDNLKVKEPPKKKEQPKETELSYEEVMIKLEKDFYERGTNEQKVLTVFHSIVRPILLNKIYREKQIEEFITLLNNPNNIMIRLKYFKDIDTSSPRKCYDSLLLYRKNLETIQPDILEGTINVFFKANKVLDNIEYLAVTNKRTQAPSQNLGENEIEYIASIKKSTKVYFIPTEITYDLASDDTLIQKKNQPFFLIDVQKNTINTEKSDIIKIVRYQLEKKQVEQETIAVDIKSQKIDQYKKIIIEGNENFE